MFDVNQAKEEIGNKE